MEFFAYNEYILRYCAQRGIPLWHACETSMMGACISTREKVADLTPEQEHHRYLTGNDGGLAALLERYGDPLIRDISG